MSVVEFGAPVLLKSLCGSVFAVAVAVASAVEVVNFSIGAAGSV
mgnify:CR=1 FL=1